MTNLFDSANYPEGLPAQIVAGNRWAWKRADLTAVYGTDDYQLKYRFKLLADPYSNFDVTANVISSVFVFEVGEDTTGDFPPGEYSWQAVVVRSSDSAEVTTDRGVVEVLPDLGANPGAEGASWTYRVLSAIRKTIEGTASREDASYSIAGRSLSRRTTAELLELEAEFSRRWAQEKRKIDRTNGRKSSNRILARLGA
jgi:hypothetical protein